VAQEVLKLQCIAFANFSSIILVLLYILVLSPCDFTILPEADLDVVGGDNGSLGADLLAGSKGMAPSGRSGVEARKLSTFSHLTFNFACNFAHELSKYLENSVGRCTTPMRMHSPHSSHLLGSASGFYYFYVVWTVW